MFELTSCDWWFYNHGQLVEYKDIIFINETSEYIQVIGWLADEEVMEYFNMKFVFDVLPNLFKRVKPNGIYKDFKIPMPVPQTGYFQYVVINEATMRKYSKEEIIEDNIYDYRYRFSSKDLEEMGFKVHFTGGDELDKFRID